MTPVGHAERIAKRHARAVEARTAVTPAHAPGPSSNRREAQQRLEAAGDEPRGKPGPTMKDGDDAPRANPFASFMGCAP